MSFFSDLLSNVKSEVIEAGQNSISNLTTVSAAKINDLFGVEPEAPAVRPTTPTSVPVPPSVSAPLPTPTSPAAEPPKSRFMIYGLVAALVVLLLFFRK